jgi:antirestriction protein ArdC
LYSKEELVAEMGSALICTVPGIAGATMQSSAAYIKGWLSVLKDDRNLLVQATQTAQKAADYILDSSTHTMNINP